MLHYFTPKIFDGHKRFRYDVAFKLNAVIEYAEENGKLAAAKEYEVNDSRVRDWCNPEN